MTFLRLLFLLVAVACCQPGPALAGATAAAPLAIGETWTIDSAILGERRRINVYLPAGIPPGTALPVMYMLDGGMHEDFLHVAGLLQVGAGNGTMRSFLLVGIENTERRRDLTGPTEVAKDRSIAPRVGGSVRFRAFLRKELMPEVAKRYQVTNERAIVGESLAGLFVIETLALEPDLFDSYIAIDPSLWWNNGALAKQLGTHGAAVTGEKALVVAASADGQGFVDRPALATGLARMGKVRFGYDSWPDESHATVYHPAALKAFRSLLKPAATRP